MKKVKFNIYFKVIIVTILTLAILNVMIPRILNYPPFSSDSDFQARVDIIPRRIQYLLLGLSGVFIYIISISKFFKNIFKYIDTKDKSKLSFEFIKKVRKDCLSAPNRIIMMHILLIVFIILLFCIFMKPSASLFVKATLIYFSFFTFIAVLSTSFIKKDIDIVITSTYEANSKYNDFKKTQKFSTNLIVYLFPFFLVLIITIALLGYANTTSAIGEGNYYYYKIYMENTDFEGLSITELIAKLDRIPLKSETDYYFIIQEDNQYFSKSDGEVTDFFLKYADAYLEKTNGRVYEYYGLEEEAYVQKLSLPDGHKVYIGFKYDTVTHAIDSFFLDILITFTFIYIIILYIWSKNLSKSLVDVTNSLIYISKNKSVRNVHVLPATTPDEIGQLSMAFNDIQKLAGETIEEIQNEHEKLLERERLASLGQLIGGIAHNLKTPIMSVSGAAEGLSDLVKEYDSSIEDSEVTPGDHHEIAKEMNDWIEKIKTHTLYMSDIITTVKGQAVTLSEEQSISFDLEELVKRVDILMKHELKYSHVNLNTSIETDPHTTLEGNIVSLVQVINNMISNSIQAYNGEPDKNIDLTISRKENNIIISVKDYGPGIPKNVEHKLFKEMITTKGKKGTGLGLFMSYSTVKAHFHGNITFESKAGKGTTFYITIPLSSN